MITSSLIWVFAVPPATTESLAFNLPVEAPGAMRWSVHPAALA